MKKIFVIIVTYNAMRWIDQCLQCLRESTIPVVPVVVDNGSTDGTREHIPSHFPEVVWLPQGENLGFGQGNNVGIRYALLEQANYIMLLNQDAYLDKEAIAHLLKADDGESMLSPLHLTGDGKKLDRNFKYYLSRVDDSPMWDDMLVNATLADRYPVPCVCAACWFMPVSVVKRVGGFDPIFFHYGEDENYTHRLEYHGIALYVAPKASMCHDRGEHGNMVAFNRNRVKRGMMVECCNINKSFIGVCARLLRYLALSYVSDLPRHQYRIGAFTGALFSLLFDIRAIIHSRNENKKPGMNWL